MGTTRRAWRDRKMRPHLETSPKVKKKGRQNSSESRKEAPKGKERGMDQHGWRSVHPVTHNT